MVSARSCSMLCATKLQFINQNDKTIQGFLCLKVIFLGSDNVVVFVTIYFTLRTFLLEHEFLSRTGLFLLLENVARRPLSYYGLTTPSTKRRLGI